MRAIVDHGRRRRKTQYFVGAAVVAARQDGESIGGISGGHKGRPYGADITV
jgi:hypothetical protein